MSIILSVLSEAFDTTPQFWMNLQQKYDLWMEENSEDSPKLKDLGAS
jgi:plasmid maintenance system antidote protein VapI